MENNKNYWKTGVIVTLIFLIGCLAGIGTLLSLRYVRERNFRPMRNPAEILTMLSEKLNLNQEQKRAVREIVLTTRRDLFTIREDARPQVRKRLEMARDEIAALLNEESGKGLISLWRNVWNRSWICGRESHGGETV